MERSANQAWSFLAMASRYALPTAAAGSTSTARAPRVESAEKRCCSSGSFSAPKRTAPAIVRISSS